VRIRPDSTLLVAVVLISAFILSAVHKFVPEAAAAPESPPGATPAAAPLAAGGGKVTVVEEKRGKRTFLVATAVMPFSRQQVWSVVSDYTTAPKVFKNLLRCEVVSANGSVKNVRQVVKPGHFPFIFDYLVAISENAPAGLTWEKVSGPFNEFSGSWKLEPAEDHGPGAGTEAGTRVSYSVCLDAGLLIPKWILNRSLKAYLPEVLRSLREYLEKSKLSQ
jgi:ribosome-associated toxin RatA of RatAB toxin-antitoxin module